MKKHMIALILVSITITFSIGYLTGRMMSITPSEWEYHMLSACVEHSGCALSMDEYERFLELKHRVKLVER